MFSNVANYHDLCGGGGSRGGGGGEKAMGLFTMMEKNLGL